MENTANISTENFTLVINSGSSSLKFAVYQQHPIKKKYSGLISHIGKEGGSLKIIDSKGSEIAASNTPYKHIEDAANAILLWLKTIKIHGLINCVGYRLVQGGPNHRSPEVITDKLLKDLGQLTFLAPNHLPDELSLVDKLRAEFPKLIHVACFDTNFHKDIPDQAKYYALPHQFKDQGLMRYGFHGLSYEYIMAYLNENYAYIEQKKIIIAHLGNGSSMAAVSLGRCVETTMGISPMGGLVMSTRSGDIDPGALLFILRKNKMTVEALDKLFSQDSGIKAIAGTGDMQKLLKNVCDDKCAADAVNLYCYQAKKFIGALAAGIGGIDLLIFTGGIGENAPQIREQICANMDFMGLKLDRICNQHNEKVISCKSSKVNVMVIATDEESVIALHAAKFSTLLKKASLPLKVKTSI